MGPNKLRSQSGYMVVFLEAGGDTKTPYVYLGLNIVWLAVCSIATFPNVTANFGHEC